MISYSFHKISEDRGLLNKRRWDENAILLNYHNNVLIKTSISVATPEGITTRD